MQWQPWQPWLAWVDAPPPAAPAPDTSTPASQVAMERLSETGHHPDRAQSGADSAPAARTDRTRLYDLAELLLSELIPGWHEDDGLDDEEDVVEDDDEEDELLPLGLPDPVVDASYQACMMEAERFLVQCEGFDAEGSVVAGLRQHLELARAHATVDFKADLVRPVAGQRHRPPGYP